MKQIIILLRTVALLIVLRTSISAQRERSVTLTSSVQFDAALPPPVLCPGVKVQFNCIAIDFPLSLDWDVNGTIVENLSPTTPVNQTMHPMPGVSVVLNGINVLFNPISADLDSTLTATLNDGVFSGDVISCGNSLLGTTTNLTVKYTDMAPPPAPQINADNLQIDSSVLINSVRFTINFDPSFTENHKVEKYCVRSQSRICSPPNGTCILPGGTYTCDGLGTGEEFNFTFTAVNCGDQESEESATVTLTPQRPSRPSFCLAYPVYNQTTKTLSGIATMWNRVTDPPNIVSSISQNVSFYNISYVSSRTIDTVSVPLSNQLCDTDGNCSYVYSVSSGSFIDPRFSYVARVAAGNIVGTGDPFFCQGRFNSRNSVFSVSTRAPTFMDDSTTIQCQFSNPPSSQNVTRECQLCYSTLVNSQTPRRCLTESTSDVDGRIVTFTIRLPSSSEESYGPFFYQLTAIEDNVTRAITQGQQYTGCRPLLLGNISTPEISSRCLSLSGQTQQVAGIKRDNNTIFCYNSGGTLLGTVATVHCDDGYVMVGPQSVTCGPDGTWGDLPRCVKQRKPTSTDSESLLGWQIALTVLGVFLWFLAAGLDVVGAVVLFQLAREKFNANFRFWHSLFIFLLVLTVLLLVISVALWIALGVVVNGSTGAGVSIAAFVLSLLAAISATVALSLTKIMPKVLESKGSIDLPHSGNGVEVKESPKDGGSGEAQPTQGDEAMLESEKKEDLGGTNQEVMNGEPSPELSTTTQESPTREQDRDEQMNDSTQALLSEPEEPKPVEDAAIRNLLHELQIEPYTEDTAVTVIEKENREEKNGDDEVTEADQSGDNNVEP